MNIAFDPPSILIPVSAFTKGRLVLRVVCTSEEDAAGVAAKWRARGFDVDIEEPVRPRRHGGHAPAA